MKKFFRIAESVGLICLIGAFGLAILNFLAILAASVGSMRPFQFMDYFRIPYWSTLLPALGILALLPLALRQAFTYGPEGKEESVADALNLRDFVDRWRDKIHLRPV